MDVAIFYKFSPNSLARIFAIEGIKFTNFPVYHNLTIKPDNKFIQSFHDNVHLFKNILINETSFTLTVHNNDSWEEAMQKVYVLINNFIEENKIEKFIHIEPSSRTEFQKKINEILDSVFPYVKEHGGNISIYEFENGKLTMSLTGACDGCAHNSTLFREKIEKIIKFLNVEVKEITWI